MRTALIPAAGMSLAACATPAGAPALVMAQAPPSLEVVKAEIDRSNASCNSDYVVRAREPDPERPVVLVRCPPHYPVLLERAGIEAACRTMFDINPAGEPANFHTQCNIGESFEAMPAVWAELAARAFPYAVQSSFARFRFQTLADALPEQRRTEVSQPTRFQFEGYGDRLQPPEAFKRPPQEAAY
jgi:hypothetical protein